MFRQLYGDGVAMETPDGASLLRTAYPAWRVKQQLLNLEIAIFRRSYEVGTIYTMYTIYERPTEYPEGYLVRRYHAGMGGALYTGDTMRAASLDKAREIIPPGLQQVPRGQIDPPEVVETWV